MAIRRDKAERLADEELMPMIAERDPEAFEVFYDRHGGAAFSLAYRIVGDRSAAEDVTQEAFISIWRSGARFDRTRGSVRSWTLGIVRNRAIDEEALRRREAAELRGAMRELPADQSKVIQLAYFGGFSQSEIARMLGMPLGTVKGRMRLGMEKMRARMAEGLS
jgi:RNA polymerase sigma-70 factor (ECF subfamily)